MIPSIYDIFGLMPKENWNYLVIGVLFYAVMSFKDGFANTWGNEALTMLLWALAWPWLLLILVINILRDIFR